MTDCVYIILGKCLQWTSQDAQIQAEKPLIQTIKLLELLCPWTPALLSPGTC